MSVPAPPTRRSFFKATLWLLGASVSLMATWGLGAFALFSKDKDKTRELPPGTLEKLQADAPLHVPDAGAWLMKQGADSPPIALDDRCPHLGCRPKWNADRSLFECPCHGSEFDHDGNLIKGPAKTGLTRLVVTTESGRTRLVPKPPA